MLLRHGFVFRSSYCFLGTSEFAMTKTYKYRTFMYIFSSAININIFTTFTFYLLFQSLVSFVGFVPIFLPLQKVSPFDGLCLV